MAVVIFPFCLLFISLILSLLPLIEFWPGQTLSFSPPVYNANDRKNYECTPNVMIQRTIYPVSFLEELYWIGLKPIVQVEICLTLVQMYRLEYLRMMFCSMLLFFLTVFINAMLKCWCEDIQIANNVLQLSLIMVLHHHHQHHHQQFHSYKLLSKSRIFGN